MNNQHALQALQDRADIHDVLMRYVRAADTRDWDLALKVFAPTLISSTAGVKRELSREDWIAGARAGSGAIPQSSRRLIQRTASVEDSTPLIHGSHFVGNISIQVTGDTAAAETYAVANMFFREGEQAYVLLRGIRYLDRLARLAEGWRITHRAHTVDWSRESPVDHVTPFEERPTLETIWPL